MIQFQNIHLRFGTQTIFDDFNLSISDGEKILLFGKSGSGKSTLFSLLLGFNFPNSGIIRFNGKPLDKFNIWELRKQVAFISQDLEFSDISVQNWLQNINEFRSNQAINFDKIESLFEEFHLEKSLLDKQMESLSGGEKQRLLLILGMLRNPPIFLLDEPTAALDGLRKSKILETVKNMKDKIVIVASHDEIWHRSDGFRTVNIEKQNDE